MADDATGMQPSGISDGPGQDKASPKLPPDHHHTRPPAPAPAPAPTPTSDGPAPSANSDAIGSQNSTADAQQNELQSPTMAAETEEQEFDEFGLPLKKFRKPPPDAQLSSASTEQGGAVAGEAQSPSGKRKWSISLRKRSTSRSSGAGGRARSSSRASRASVSRASSKGVKPLPRNNADSDSDDDFKDAASKPVSGTATPRNGRTGQATSGNASSQVATTPTEPEQKTKDAKAVHKHNPSTASAGAAEPAQVSEFSHQLLSTKKEEKDDDDDGGWQTMPAFAPFDIYNDDNKLVAREYNEDEDDSQKVGYAGLGGAGKGYTRVVLDDDAESATSMDDNTNYLFKNAGGSTSLAEDDEEARDAVSQLQATKELLTEGQRVAYVGLIRLELARMTREFEEMEKNRKTKKEIRLAFEAMKMWAQKMMIRLYAHMEISTAEQVMIEQLSDHGVIPADLTPVLMANSRVKNPMAAKKSEEGKDDEKPEDSGPPAASDTLSPPEKSRDLTPSLSPRSSSSLSRRNSKIGTETPPEEDAAAPPPPYEAHSVEEMPDVKTPMQLGKSQKIDIDLRWTVLCDLFLVLIADSIYDARSRRLLERVAESLEITWLDICRFEKKVTDALEMQQNAEKENWNEDEHMETRRKLALRRRYVMMGLATVGGGLVIGLSAGLLAPMIGAGLAAGFGAVGVAGTNTFLTGGAAAALITSGAATSGGVIGVRAANRRTGAVRTFEYRPLHNNKRVNLIVTVSGWMTGKVDDVRLPFSTIDSIMGDIYSVLWEPEMLRSMGDTINLLATEALTQGLQQVLASTFLTVLMGALQLPVILSKLAYLIDNPWSVSLDRATAAGLILADSLIDRNLGTRPVTLVGYSLGSRVIYSCLRELARKGAMGLVQNVYLFGAPVVVNLDDFVRVRTVVAGKFVNGYNTRDWILGYLFRLTGGGVRRVAGLAAIEGVPGLENIDVSEIVQGHMDYRAKMPRLLRESGWLVESDEFTEIEDPDPENHASRQRELINEIEEARKELEKEAKAEKSGGFFSFARKKKAAKKDWEIYEDVAGKSGATAGGGGKTEDKDGNNHGVLFDVDAIRTELAKEKKREQENPEDLMLQVRELESTLPPMKLDVTPSPTPPPSSMWRSETPGADLTINPASATSLRSSYEYRKSSESRTPTFPAQFQQQPHHRSVSYNVPSHHHHDAHDTGFDDDHIQMTFDTSFDERPAPLSSRAATIPAGPPPAVPPKDYNTAAIPVSSSSSFEAAAAASANNTTNNDGRPGMKTSQTVPNITLADPWADDDDPDFGKEKEISMTFA